VQFPTLLGLVAANTGVTIVPASLRALHLPDLRYVALSDPQAASTVSVAYRADRQQVPAIRHFLDVASSLDLTDETR
jgi:DNA-binding transcriptional LysR family regulator